MSHQFTLLPDLDLLYRCGFLTADMQQWAYDEVNANGIITIEYDGIWTEDKRNELQNRFTELANRFNLTEHSDTLLYVSLLESGHYDASYQRIYNNFTQRLRDKQLAQFLLLFKPGNKHLPINLKVSTLTDTVKLTDVELIGWLGTLMQEFIGKANFIPGKHGETLFKFIVNEQGNVDFDGGLNYEIIEYLANQTIRKPGIRDRNKLLSSFLLNLWNVLNRETILTTQEGVKFSDNQLRFLFEVAEIFGWLDRFSIDSDPKDYLYNLLARRY